MQFLNMIVIGAATTLGATGAGVLAQKGEIACVIVHNETLTGAVGTVDLENSWFSLTTEDGASHDIAVSDETTYTLDGEASTAEEVLESGSEVEVTVDADLNASAVSRTSDL